MARSYRTPREQKEYRREYERMKQTEYRGKYPERYTRYALRTHIKKAIKLGMDVRNEIETILREAGI